MIEQFNRLPAADRDAILQACMAEFAHKGYAQASTNVMVNHAGIPKGTLFYYFGSKKGLFLDLVDHAVRAYHDFAADQDSQLPADLFDRLIFMVDVRMQFAVQHPLLYRFLSKALLNIPDGLTSEMEARFTAYSAASSRFMQNGVDTSMLREGVALDQVLELVGMLQEGMLARFSKTLSEMEAEDTLLFVENMMERTKAHFEMIKRGVYRRD